MRKFLFLAILPALLYLGGCSENTVEPLNNKENAGTLMKDGLPKVIHDELQAVKAATARYHNIENALADGYVDINVVVPNMGHHFLNPAYLDSQFVATQPEILVYELRENGHYKLVAVEYGVPLNFDMPEGFPGSYDAWEANTDAGIWALHAWIWKINPDGVFAPFNPNVP